jgi:hypothetical protein
MKRTFKRVLSFLLSFAVFVMVVPFAALPIFAADYTETIELTSTYTQVEQVETLINGATGRASVSGGTVTVTGSFTFNETYFDYISILIYPGVTVKWEATLIDTYVDINGNSTGGTFEMAGGSITYDSHAIRNIVEAVKIKVSGGRVYSPNDENDNEGAIKAAGDVEIIGGEIISENYSAVELMSNGHDDMNDRETLTVSGSALIKANSDSGAIEASSYKIVNINGGIITGDADNTGEEVLRHAIKANDHTTINVNGGTLNGGIYLDEYDELNIEGGTVTNHGPSVHFYSGYNELNVNGGTLTSSFNGTIFTSTLGTGGTNIVNISGGTVRNIGTALFAIDGDFAEINISGGEVYAPYGAIDTTGDVTVSEVTVGSTVSLTATVTPDNAANKNLAWTSNDTNVAIVSTSGIVTARNAGTVTITATSVNNITGTITITVNPIPVTPAVPVTGVTIGGLQTLTVGESTTLTAAIAPTDASNQNVTWSSDNTAVATVTNGIVTAISAGTANITITTAEGPFTATLAITVNAPQIPEQPAPEPPDEPEYYYDPYPVPRTPAPAPDAPPAPEENPYVLPSMDVEETEEGTNFTTANGVTSTVTETDEGEVKVQAGVNESGSINSQATAAAVAEAAKIAAENGETSVAIQIPEGAVGLSKSTVQKLVDAAGGMEITLELTAMVDGEVVGGVTLPITDETGQILTGLDFDTTRIDTAKDFITNKWNTDILGSFETAQKGGWGGTATLSVGLDILGFEADDGTKLYALIYDPKADKWYEVPAEVIDRNVVFDTKRSGIITIVTKSVKK